MGRAREMFQFERRKVHVWGWWEYVNYNFWFRAELWICWVAQQLRGSASGPCARQLVGVLKYDSVHQTQLIYPLIIIRLALMLAYMWTISFFSPPPSIGD
jgi:hypothetical protein